jgi:cellulose synthase/poly-beta-1,6-N-acetylglucosamine synthase-like glycosyltransferase
MGFDYTLGSISIGASAFATLLNVAFFPLFLVITLAFFLDGVETILRLRAFSRNQGAAADFRQNLRGDFAESDTEDFTLILPTFRRREELEECIKHLLDTRIPKEKILVVDDFSDDGFQNASVAANYGLRVVAISRNTKKVGATMVGARLAKSKYVILMDDDSFLVSDYSQIKQAILEMETLGLDAMAGIVLPQRGRTPPSKSSGKLLFELQYLEYEQAMQLGRGAMYEVGRVQNENPASATNIEVKHAEVTSVSGAFGIFRTEALLRAESAYESAEENFSGEDIERTFKILATNGKIGYSDQLLIQTICPCTLKAHFKQRINWSEGFFRCFCSRFGLGICKKKTSASIYSLYVSRDILLHPLKLLFLPLLLINFPLFITLLAFYTVLNLVTVAQVRSQISISRKAVLLLPIYRLYITIFPTTVGYTKGLVHAARIVILKSAGKIHILPINIVKTWNLTSENVC